MVIDNTLLERLEDLPLRPDEAWYVLLVYLGLKKGAWIQIKSDIWREGDVPKQVSPSSRTTIEETLRMLSIKYQVQLRDMEYGPSSPENSKRARYYQIADFFIAKTENIVTDIINGRKNNDDTLLGISLGYPKTAVDAFNTGDKIFVANLSISVRLSEAGQLTYFALSKDNWQDELAVVEEWVSAVKKNSGTMWQNLQKFGNMIDQELIDSVTKS